MANLAALFALDEEVPKLAQFALHFSFDPPGHGRIGGHYVHTGCPYTLRYIEARKTKQWIPCVKIMTAYWLGPDGSS